MNSERVLVVDDEKLIRWSLREKLEEAKFLVEEAGTGQAAINALAASDFDLMILDHKLPDILGLDVLARVHKDHPDLAVVVMTAYGTIEDAVKAMRLGAFDFLTKPVDSEQLMLVVKKSLETTRLRREVRRLREQQSGSQAVRLIGKSKAMRDVSELIQKIGTSPANTVLLQGESGTGKDIVARAIHFSSMRADRPFVNITCSALPETLLESELFGHERGAFTDAKKQKKGLLETAHGGTVFLDEIGEMGLSMQAKLLRFLEDKTFRRIGGTRDIRVDLRIIAATNRVLGTLVHEGSFRGDLFYRLNVIPITLPPLRERMEDVPLLVQHFIESFAEEFHKQTRGISSRAMEAICSYSWPGNIRELRNVIERVMILENKVTIELEDLPRSITDLGTEEGHGEDLTSLNLPLGRLSLEEIERSAIEQALRTMGHNQVRAARLLGISRDTLRYRMKKFALLNAET